MLKNITKKKSYNILGVMSGTSMDGIDISIIKTNGTNYARVINEKSYGYSLALENKIKKIIKNKKLNNNTIIKYYKQNEDLINKLYIFFIRKFLNEFKINKDKIDFISLSGQTVYHDPLKKITIQLGSGKLLQIILKLKLFVILEKMILKIKAKELL